MKGVNGKGTSDSSIDVHPFHCNCVQTLIFKYFFLHLVFHCFFPKRVFKSVEILLNIKHDKDKRI